MRKLSWRKRLISFSPLTMWFHSATVNQFRCHSLKLTLRWIQRTSAYSKDNRKSVKLRPRSMRNVSRRSSLRREWATLFQQTRWSACLVKHLRRSRTLRWRVNAWSRCRTIPQATVERSSQLLRPLHSHQEVKECSVVWKPNPNRWALVNQVVEERARQCNLEKQRSCRTI